MIQHVKTMKNRQNRNTQPIITNLRFPSQKRKYTINDGAKILNNSDFSISSKESEKSNKIITVVYKGKKHKAIFYGDNYNNKNKNKKNELFINIYNNKINKEKKEKQSIYSKFDVNNNRLNQNYFHLIQSKDDISINNLILGMIQNRNKEKELNILKEEYNKLQEKKIKRYIDYKKDKIGYLEREHNKFNEEIRMYLFNIKNFKKKMDILKSRNIDTEEAKTLNAFMTLLSKRKKRPENRKLNKYIENLAKNELLFTYKKKYEKLLEAKKKKEKEKMKNEKLYNKNDLNVKYKNIQVLNVDQSKDESNDYLTNGIQTSKNRKVKKNNSNLIFKTDKINENISNNNKDEFNLLLGLNQEPKLNDNKVGYKNIINSRNYSTISNIFESNHTNIYFQSQNYDTSMVNLTKSFYTSRNIPSVYLKNDEGKIKVPSLTLDYSENNHGMCEKLRKNYQYFNKTYNNFNEIRTKTHQNTYNIQNFHNNLQKNNKNCGTFSSLSTTKSSDFNTVLNQIKKRESKSKIEGRKLDANLHSYCTLKLNLDDINSIDINPPSYRFQTISSNLYNINENVQTCRDSSKSPTAKKTGKDIRSSNLSIIPKNDLLDTARANQKMLGLTFMNKSKFTYDAVNEKIYGNLEGKDAIQETFEAMVAGYRKAEKGTKGTKILEDIRRELIAKGLTKNKKNGKKISK